jgi:drug/metabolite transporter (DMT)-like permease
MNIKYIITIILNSFFIVIAQMFLKTGMNKEQMLSIKIFFNPKIIIGLIIYVIATLIWLYLLPKVVFSIAYPLNSVAYIFSMFMSYFLLGETITITKIIGTLIIIAGIIIIVQ